MSGLHVRNKRCARRVTPQFTSGTTGLPKAAALTHRNILNNGLMVARGCRYTEQDRYDNAYASGCEHACVRAEHPSHAHPPLQIPSPSARVCVPVPLFHCFGQVMGSLACITHGATMVFPSGKEGPLGGVPRLCTPQLSPRCLLAPQRVLTRTPLCALLRLSGARHFMECLQCSLPSSNRPGGWCTSCAWLRQVPSCTGIMR